MSDDTTTTTSSIQDLNYDEWTEIDVDQFTSNVEVDETTHTVNGSGFFDTLMETATKHLVAQYDGNRIRSEDYADAYVTIYQNTLAVCADLWTKKPLEKANLQLLIAQCELAYAQAEEARLKPELLKAQIELAKTQVEVALIQLEITKQQLEQEKEKVALIHAQTVQALAAAELANAQTKTELAKPNQLIAQTGLILAQTDSERIKPLYYEAQLRLLEAQIELAKYQARSELAKRDLYRRQIEGFDEDFKQKILKINMDSWAVGFSVAKDSFEASGIPAPMQKTTIDDLYNDYIVTELDSHTYKRTDEVLNGYDD